jgi:hypothetical protein
VRIFTPAKEIVEDIPSIETPRQHLVRLHLVSLQPFFSPPPHLPLHSALQARTQNLLLDWDLGRMRVKPSRSTCPRRHIIGAAIGHVTSSPNSAHIASITFSRRVGRNMKDRSRATTTRNCTCATSSYRPKIAKDRFSSVRRICHLLRCQHGPQLPIHATALRSLSTGHPAKTSVTAVHDRLPGFASCNFDVGTIGRSILTVQFVDLGFIQRAVRYALCVLRSRVRELRFHGRGTRTMSLE